MQYVPGPSIFIRVAAHQRPAVMTLSSAIEAGVSTMYACPLQSDGTMRADLAQICRARRRSTSVGISRAGAVWAHCIGIPPRRTGRAEGMKQASSRWRPFVCSISREKRMRLSDLADFKLGAMNTQDVANHHQNQHHLEGAMLTTDQSL